MQVNAIAEDGWHSAARRAESPNQDARPEGADLRLLVVHGISLPPGKFGGDGVEELFLNKSKDGSVANLRVSAHFFIRRDGGLVQFVPCTRRAWHAGESTWNGEQSCNDFSVGVELEGADDVAYANGQYAALETLVSDLCARYPSLCAIAGHSDIAPSRKTDPGPSFDWGRLFAAVGKKMDGRKGRPS